MIITKIQGGLGNQLFQWALYKTFKSQGYQNCFIDKNIYDIQISITPREFSLDKFPNIEYDLYDGLRNVDYKYISDNFHFQNFTLTKDKNYYFNGYWQTEKYFKEIENIIRFELSPTQEISNNLHKIIPKKNNSVSLHIRRTDYLTTNGFHPVQEISYYNKGLEIIGDYDFLYVFSDDINWCKENLNYNNMIFIENNDNVTDIWLQSFCKNNIIANSSFSWWGAWLNDNTNKKVVAPLKWFGNHSNINTKDIIPNDWIII